MSRPSCPHCSEPLDRFELPENTGWDQPIQLACFNDECPYYVRSWDWMQERFGVRAGYRYRRDPETGHESPLPVWSPTALRDRVTTEEDETSAAKTDRGAFGAGEKPEDRE